MMRIRQGFALLGTMMVVAACSGSEGGVGDYTSAPLDTDDQRASYGIGLNMGGQISETKDRLDRAAFFRGVEDGLFRNDPSVDREELQRVLEAFAAEMQELAAAEAEREAAEASEAGAAYLAENAAREGVVTTESGLQYEVLREGAGPTPTREQSVRLHYRGTLPDEREFDSSYDGEPAVFGVGQVIPGFTEALMLMAPGSHYRVVIPGHLAYGPQRRSDLIGPNQTLVFEIEVLEIIEGG
jgi:FKBP-type peptidyl-prolyl cis-trans isomerase